MCSSESSPDTSMIVLIYQFYTSLDSFQKG